MTMAMKRLAAESSEAEPRTAGVAARNGLPAWGVALVLALPLSFLYGPGLKWRFIYDDTDSIVENESIRSLWPLIGTNGPGPLNPAPEFPTSGRPLVNLSMALSYWLGGLNPYGYHLVNLVLHFLCAMLLWTIVRRTLEMPRFGDEFLRSSNWLAVALTLLWALHPLQTETVAFATQRTELMMALFYLATLYCSLRYWAAEGAPTSRKCWLALAVVACLCGMASKEVMVSAPVIVLMYERTFVRGSLAECLRKSWPLYVGTALTWILLAALNVSGPRAGSAGFSLGVSAYSWWLTQSKVFFMYMQLVLCPWPLLIHYEPPYFTSMSEAWMYVVPLMLIAVGALVAVWKNWPVGFVAAWLGAILSPTFVVPIVTEIAGERRMYLALIAPVILFVIGGYRLARANDRARGGAPGGEPVATWRRPWIWAFVAILLLLSFTTATRVSMYKDEINLWLQVLDRYPNDYLAHHSVGALSVKMGDDAAGIAHYREATRLNPKAAQAHYALGLLLKKQGEFDEAITHFLAAARLAPKSASICNNLGVAQYVAGHNDDAIATFRKTIEIDSKYWTAYQNLGIALRRTGKYPEAVDALEAAIQIDPQQAAVYIDLARTYLAMKQPEKAAEALQRGIAAASAAGDDEGGLRLKAELQKYNQPAKP